MTSRENSTRISRSWTSWSRTCTTISQQASNPKKSSQRSSLRSSTKSTTSQIVGTKVKTASTTTKMVLTSRRTTTSWSSTSRTQLTTGALPRGGFKTSHTSLSTSLCTPQVWIRVLTSTLTSTSQMENGTLPFMCTSSTLQPACTSLTSTSSRSETARHSTSS